MVIAPIFFSQPHAVKLSSRIFVIHTTSIPEVQWRTSQSPLTTTVQSRRISLFGHIALTDGNIDAVCTSSGGLERPPGHLHITWLKTVQNGLKCHNLTLIGLRTAHSGGCWQRSVLHALIVPAIIDEDDDDDDDGMEWMDGWMKLPLSVFAEVFVFRS